MFDYIKLFAKERREHVERELRNAGYPMPADAPPEVSAPRTAAAGTTVLLTGRNLGRHSLTGASPYPASLGATRVELGGRPARLVRVSPEEIEFEIPRDYARGAVIVVVVAPGGRSLEMIVEVTEPVE
jgi:uncharacterized protein (TIGR03437 family)